MTSKTFDKFLDQQIKVLKSKASETEDVMGLLVGDPQTTDGGKKIKGTLAYAGVSLNNRLYLPEELKKGDGMTVPLILNHASTSGAEEELDRLPQEFRSGLESGKEMRVGEVSLQWDPDNLTLFYEGNIEDKFFQREVDDANMAVSLGMYYDSDSPQVCDEACNTVIKGAEYHEVSLVYHPGFPIATILSWVFDKTPQGFVKTDVNETEDLDFMVEFFSAYTFSKARKGMRGRVSSTVGAFVQIPTNADIYPYRLFGSVDVDITRQLKMVGEVFYDPFFLDLYQVVILFLSNLVHFELLF